jgi:hypothetical protein
MIRRSNATVLMLLGAAVAATLLAGCSSAKSSAPIASAIASLGPSTTPSGPPAASGSASALASALPSGSASGSPAASASEAPTDSLAHIDTALESQLPATIQSVPLVRFSMVLSAFIASPPTGGDKVLYAAWLVKFGKIPSDVHIAISFELSDTVNFNARAIGVPGVSATSLTSGFADVARKAGWTVKEYPNLMSTGKDVTEMIDPAAVAAGSAGAGYVYARSGVLYEIVTDDETLLENALIQMP